MPKAYNCVYCSQRGSEDQGIVSCTLYETDEFNNKYVYWFCSMCCMMMKKYELGYKTISHEMYQDIKNKVYKKQ